MPERISVQLANNRGRYSRFIPFDGSVASLYSLETLHGPAWASVGIMCRSNSPKRRGTT
jgi:hypothetical protein